MKQTRIVLHGEAAKLFYLTATKDHKFTGFSNDFVGIGGYYLSEVPSVYIAFDFTNGEEVFIEEFEDIEEAKKYATGIEARTKDGVII